MSSVVIKFSQEYGAFLQLSALVDLLMKPMASQKWDNLTPQLVGYMTGWWLSDYPSEKD